jgi:DNA-directed RNA polymerase subunit M/transcription elongation factor TFIIS
MSEQREVGDLPLSVYCPECGAMLLVLSESPDVQCDQCGAEFEIITEAP